MVRHRPAQKESRKMFSINTNAAALTALSSLNTTTAALDQTQTEISTGSRVSSASDNPAIYSIANSMTANQAGLSAVQDSLSYGQSAVSLASSAAAQISSQLASLQQTVTQAQTGGMDQSTMQNQVNAILTNINQMANSATFNGVNLLNGSSPNLSVVQDIQGDQLTVANQNATTSGLGLSNLATNASAMELSFNNSFAPANGDKVTLSDGTKNYVFEFSDGSAPLTTTPNANTTVFAVQVTPSSQSNMQMVGAMISSMNQQGFGAVLNSNGSLDIAGKGITEAASTATFTGGGVSESAVTGSTAAIAIVQSAVNQMNTKAAVLGAASQQITGMQSFSSSLSNSLTTGLGALTDADMAAESAKLQSLQTKQQLAIQSLSIANQQPQSLMSLFRG
jgi:flagellin